MIIYKTTNLINNKIYIGKDKKNNSKYLGSGKILKRAIKKYGQENFKKEILETCIDLEHLNEREKYWIEVLTPDYNIAKGGDGGDTFTNNPNKEKIRENYRKSNKKYLIENGSHWKKLDIDEKIQYKNKISEGTKKGLRKRTQEEINYHKNNLSIAGLISWEIDEKRRENLSKKMSGENNPMSLVSIAKRHNCSVEEAKKYTPKYKKGASEYVKQRASETHKNKHVSQKTIEKTKVKNLKYIYFIYDTLLNGITIIDNLHLFLREQNETGFRDLDKNYQRALRQEYRFSVKRRPKIK